MPPQTNVASFILRFVQETTVDEIADTPGTGWHGIIKHVQTNNELRFTTFPEAVAFIASYVRLHEPPETTVDGSPRPKEQVSRPSDDATALIQDEDMPEP